MKERLCEVCKKPFDAKTKDQIVCSKKCAGALGGRAKHPNKGFGSGNAKEMAARSAAVRRKKREDSNR